MLHHTPYMQKLTLVCQALRNRQVMRLFVCVIYSSYNFILGSEKRTGLDLIDDIIESLIASQSKKINISELRRVSENCNTRLMHSHVKENNFSKTYQKYRKLNKVKYEYTQVQKYIVGRKIMDFGSGDGLFSEHLTKFGYDVWGTDVKDYRKHNKIKSRFSLIDIQSDFVLPPLRFDTTIIKSVFHHIGKDKLELFLNQIYGVTKSRVLIKEDIIVEGRRAELPSKDVKNVLFERYSKLTLKEQFQFLALMDYFGNCVVQGLWFINLPFNFNSIGEWKKILGKHKFNVRKIVPVLFDMNMLHSGPHVWFICDVDR